MGERIDFERIFENGLQVALLLDTAGIVLAASNCYLQGVGLTRAAAVGRPLCELPPYADAPRSKACLLHALSLLRGHAVLVPHDLPDSAACASGAHWRKASNEAIRDTRSRLLCVRHELQTAVASDSGDAIRERELRKLFEHSYEAIALVDAVGRFTFVTPSIRHVLGYSEQEFIDAPPPALVHPDDSERFGAELAQIFARPSGLMMARFRARHRDGSYRTVECTNANRLHDPDVAAMIVTFRDISAQVALQDELHRGHEQLQLTLSAARAIPWTWDETQRTFGYPPGAEAFFEFQTRTPADLEPMRQVIHPADEPALMREVERCLASGEAFSCDYRGPDRAENTRWYRCHGRLLSEPTEAQPRLVGITWDITEHKRLEQERELLGRRVLESQKLESLGVLAGGIAHDFNNILMTILGNTSLTQSALPADSKALPFVAQIDEGARRAAELCRQMLAYAGKGRFVLTHCRLNDLVESTTHLLHVSISKKVVLRFHLHPNLPTVLADTTQLCQVLMNFVINASDAIGDRSGVISINTGIVRADRAYLDATALSQEIAEGDYAYLEVSDTGCGMTEQTQARIFDPFYSTKFTGRGLGLAAVLGIVRGHKGAIKVYSELGKGSSFKLLLPVSSELAADATKSPRLTKLDVHGSILVVDDEESVIAVAAKLLEKLGFEVLTAPDGREAVRVFQTHRSKIIAVLMDLTMPHLDGEQAFHELRRLSPSIPVLLMSGYNEQDAVARFVGKGLAGFIQKPFGLAELHERLLSLLG